MHHFVYILHSEKLDRYYVGVSHAPEIRLFYHNSGKGGWSKRGIPWRLVFVEEFSSRSEALKRERFIKKQKSRVFLEELIASPPSH
ncbi:MAG: GIY-YIG nuclease family protein [bacterium]